MTKQAEERGYRNKGCLEYDILDLRYYLGFHELSSQNNTYSGVVGYRCFSSRYHTDRIHAYGNDYRSLYGFRPCFNDSALSYTLAQSVQGLGQACLPQDTASIKILVKTNVGGDKYVVNEDTTDIVTRLVVAEIEAQDMHFDTVYEKCLEDFMLYGNAVCVLLPREHKKQPVDWSLMHLPFEHTYFGHYEDSSSIGWCTACYEFQALECTMQQEIKVHKTGDVWRVEYELRRKGERTTVKSFSYEYDKDVNPLFIAREARYFNTPYGMGSGIKSLGFVKNINWASEYIKYTTDKLIAPSIVKQADITFVSKSGMNVFDHRPGSVISAVVATVGKNVSDSFTLLKTDPVNLQALTMVHERELRMMQGMFFVDPAFSLSADAVGKATATEIQQRKAANLILYKGKARNFRSGIIKPYIKALMQLKFKKQVPRDTKIEIELFSADKAMSSQLSMETQERVTKYLMETGNEHKVTDSYVNKYMDSASDIVF